MPFGFAPVLLPPLPPLQERSSISGTNLTLRLIDRLLALSEGRTKSVMAAIVQSQLKRDNPGDRSMPTLRDVVVTLTVKVAGALASTFSVGGTEQMAPFGRPVQLNEPTPPIPLPPIESMWVAGFPRRPSPC